MKKRITTDFTDLHGSEKTGNLSASIRDNPCHPWSEGSEEKGETTDSTDLHGSEKAGNPSAPIRDNPCHPWSKKCLGDLCVLSSETSFPPDSGVPVYIGLEHVSSGAFHLSRSASPKDFKSNAFVFQPGDVLYGKLRPYLDKAVLAPSAGVCSTELLVLRPNVGVPPEYLLGILHSPDFVAYAQSSADKQYPRTSWSWISQFPCPHHDPIEQRAIAVVLSKVQEAVEVEGELVSVTRELKQAALRQLFTRGLRGEPQKETEIGPVPESWEVVRVIDCVLPFRFNRSQQLPASQYSTIGRFPIVDQGQELIAGYCDDDRRLMRSQEPLIIFGDHTRCLKFIDFPFVLGADGTKPLIAHSNWDASTLFYALSTVQVEARGYNRHFKQFSEKLVARPKDIAEQREIASILRTIDDKIAFHEKRQRLLREMFRTLLHDLMTGRRRVAGVESAISPEGTAR